MPKATVKITIDEFLDPFAGPEVPPKLFKPYDMIDASDHDGWLEVTRPNGEGSAQGGTGKYQDGVVKIIKPGHGGSNLDLTFEVWDNAKDPARYNVCGLIFSIIKKERLEALALSPETGRDVFPEFTSDADGDLTVKRSKDESAKYHFLLLIQNACGGVGIIDPQISNQ